MNVEIITIGTELLLGYLVDTNSSWMGEKLAQAGIDSYFQCKVGDNIERINEALEMALQRSDIVICCGGLGPTQDDLTKNAIAKVMQCELVKDLEVEQTIIQKFTARGRTMASNNLSQAYKPQGAKILTAFPGTAPGLHCETANHKHIFAVPGVPSEMKEMFMQDILPTLLKMQGSQSTLHSITLKVAGLGESDIAEKLHEVNQELDLLSQPKLSFLASGINGIKVRLTAKAETFNQAIALIEPYENRIKAILGDTIFGYENDSLESVVLAQLQAKNLSLAIFESLSSGLMHYRLAEYEAANQVLKGSHIEAVSQNNLTFEQQKQQCLNQVQAVKTQFKSDIAIATYGNYSINKAQDKNANPIFIAITWGDKNIIKEFKPPIEIKKIKEFLVFHALNELRLFLSEMR